MKLHEYYRSGINSNMEKASENGRSFNPSHVRNVAFDWDNTITKPDPHRDLKEVGRNFFRHFRQAPARALQQTLSQNEGASRLKLEARRWLAVPKIALWDALMYKQIREEFPQVLQELKELLPQTSFVINSGRPEHQRTDTQRQLERKISSSNVSPEMRFKPAHILDETDSKTQTIEYLIARDNETGNHESMVLAVDDNLEHALSFAGVGPRVFVYWIPTKRDLAKTLRANPQTLDRLPANVKYVPSLKTIPVDIRQRLDS